MRATINVTVKRGKAERVAERLRAAPGVRRSTAVFGWCDVFLLADVADGQELKSLVRRVARTRGVLSTETFPELIH